MKCQVERQGARFFYDGDELIAEYSASGAMLRRYVHGASVGDPLVLCVFPVPRTSAMLAMKARM